MLDFSTYNKESENKLVKLNATGQHFFSNLLNNKGVGMCIHEVVYNEYGFACNYKILKINFSVLLLFHSTFSGYPYLYLAQRCLLFFCHK